MTTALVTARTSGPQSGMQSSFSFSCKRKAQICLLSANLCWFQGAVILWELTCIFFADAPQCLVEAVLTEMLQQRGIQLDQEVSAQALVPSAPPLGTRREMAPREKEKARLKAMSTPAIGEGQATHGQEDVSCKVSGIQDCWWDGDNS